MNAVIRKPSRYAALLPLALLLGLTASSVDAAGTVKDGRSKASVCQTCHGLDGMSRLAEAPNIAGQTDTYLVLQLRAFKAGARKSDIMSVIASGLSEQDIDDVAAYFSAIEIRIVSIPGG